MATSTDGYSLLKTIVLPGNVGGHGDVVTYDADTKTMWVAQSPDNNVVVIDTATNTIKATIPNIGNANSISLTPQYAFVSDVTNNSIDVIDKLSFKVVATLPQINTTPDSVVYIPSMNEIAIASDDNNTETFISATAPFTQKAVLTLQPDPSAPGPDLATYVASKDLLYQPDNQQIDVINPHTHAIVATWDVLSSGNVKPLVYDPVTNDFIVGTTNNQLLVVNGDTGQVINTITVPGSVDEASIDVNGRQAYFGDKSGVADIVNLDTDKLVGGLPAEKNMHTLAVDPTTTDVYVYENNRNTIDVFAPDPAKAPEFGTIAHDLKSAAGQVYALYAGLLSRAPDALGGEGFANALNTGTSLHEVAQAILNSPEGQTHFAATVDNKTLVDDLYQTVLGRSADASGEQGWIQALNNGTSRADVADSFVFSTEHTNQLQPALNAGVFVADATDANIARLYVGVLDRTPDAGGLQGWETAAHNGTSLQSIVNSFLSSSEYNAQHPNGLTNIQFVDTLYHDALGRAAEASGEQYWVQALDSGSQTRAQVALGIVESSEAQHHLVNQVEIGWHLT